MIPLVVSTSTSGSDFHTLDSVGLRGLTFAILWCLSAKGRYCFEWICHSLR